MKLTPLKAVLFFAVATTILVPVKSVFAATIDISATPITGTFTKNGLAGSFYSVETDGNGNTLITSDANANAWVAGHSATGTFTSTQAVLDTNGGYGTTTGSTDKNTEASFLGTDSASLAPTAAGTTIQGTNILTIIGYIDVTGNAATNYTLTDISNDGTFLTIGGTTVVNVGDSTSATPTTTTDTLVFTNGPGIYAIDLTYWNEAYDGAGGKGAGGTGNTGTGNELGLNLVGAGGAVVTFGTTFSTPPGVPEPSTWVAMILGMLMMGGLVLKQRKAMGSF